VLWTLTFEILRGIWRPAPPGPGHMGRYMQSSFSGTQLKDWTVLRLKRLETVASGSHMWWIRVSSQQGTYRTVATGAFVSCHGQWCDDLNSVDATWIHMNINNAGSSSQFWREQLAIMLWYLCNMHIVCWHRLMPIWSTSLKNVAFQLAQLVCL